MGEGRVAAANSCRECLLDRPTLSTPRPYRLPHQKQKVEDGGGGGTKGGGDRAAAVDRKLPPPSHTSPSPHKIGSGEAGGQARGERQRPLAMRTLLPSTTRRPHRGPRPPRQPPPPAERDTGCMAGEENTTKPISSSAGNKLLGRQALGWG